MKITLASIALAVAFALPALAQGPPDAMPGPFQGPPMGPHAEGGPGAMGPHGGGAWWKDARLRQKLQLSDEQSQKIAKIAQEHELREIDLRAAAEKQDAVLRNLMESDTPDKAQVLAQVDKLSEARAELEKSHMDLFLSVRQVLTADQAKKLRELPHGGGPREGGPREGGPQGPGMTPPAGAPSAPPEAPPQ